LFEDNAVGSLTERMHSEKGKEVFASEIPAKSHLGEGKPTTTREMLGQEERVPRFLRIRLRKGVLLQSQKAR